MRIVRETPWRLRLQPEGGMRVPGVVFASEALLPDPAVDKSLEQVANVATLPGIVRASYAMPDMHWGYGFPIGGVAATDVEAGGVVSPGGVGFDISCGVRLLAAPGLDRASAAAHLHTVMDRLGHAIPRGAGRGGVWHLRGRGELEKLLLGGSRYAVEAGHGVSRTILIGECLPLGVAHAARAVGASHPSPVSRRRQVGPAHTQGGWVEGGGWRHHGCIRRPGAAGGVARVPCQSASTSTGPSRKRPRVACTKRRPGGAPHSFWSPCSRRRLLLGRPRRRDVPAAGPAFRWLTDRDMTTRVPGTRSRSGVRPR